MRDHNEKNLNREMRMAQYEAADINDKIMINMRDLSHIMRRLYEGRASQKRILIVLNEVGVITQRELTKRLGVQPGTASEVIAKLENAGLITRTPSEADRRTADIALTESGKTEAVKAAEQRSRRHEEMFSGLSGEEKTELLRMLERINADWEQRYCGMNEICEHPKHSCGRHNHHH